jgi:hypothetical protein
MSDLPTPKYRIGQTVWFAATRSTTATLPCPDCLGKKVWKVEMPSGATLETPCQRCQGGYLSSGRQDDCLRLDYQAYEAAPGSFIIENVEARTKGHFAGEGPEITYWSNNGGRKEDALFATEEEARARSQVMADEANAKIVQEPAVLEQRHIGTLKIDEALYNEFKNGLWSSWYRYRSLLDRMTEVLDGIDDDKPLTKGQIKQLDEAIRFEANYYAKQPHPMDDLIKAAHVLLDESVPSSEGFVAMQNAVLALPEALHKPFLPVKEAWEL